MLYLGATHFNYIAKSISLNGEEDQIIHNTTN